MAKGKIRHLFSGGHTPDGFYSFYHSLIPIPGNRIFIVKGGPGTGKAKFMRKMGEALAGEGSDVEYHHCSSNNNLLDGVVLPELQVAFIDGAIPYIFDMENTGGVDEIIYLGEFWDENNQLLNKDQVLAHNSEIRNSFRRAHRMLRAAKAIYDDWEAIHTRAMDFATANGKASDLVNDIFFGLRANGAGKVRRLFASAITGNGPVHYLETSVWRTAKCYVIKGAPGTGKSTVVQKLIEAAVVRGLDVEVFYCPLDPEKPEHLVIPAISVAVTTAITPHNQIPDKPAAVIDMNDCLNKTDVEKYDTNTAYDRRYFWELFEQAISCIRLAKKLQDDLETCHIPGNNFDGIQAVWEKTLARVLAYRK
ncbi:MAG TPA: hypothetical protein PKA28_07785 [Methylomusa anaerophila]|uniref:ATPase n=1 Tax=Methylomusa anaerophila TaxID=1930071 RepID=A0A348AFU3_9FIRM|nr:ATPase [Methylomusa anaerophila]BBB89941.1 hypothetical protein MAMMFC1_00581 [Methylomusa anaerophila]HML88332.1 hypothetical protein [Methylomusa anaerophila]